MSILITWLDRAGRPLLRLTLPLVLIYFVWRVFEFGMHAAQVAIDKGQPIPDLSAGLGPIIMTLSPLIAPLVIDQFTRHRERARQIAFDSVTSSSSTPRTTWQPEGVNIHGAPNDPA
jgi:hypothetical protein